MTLLENTWENAAGVFLLTKSDYKSFEKPWGSGSKFLALFFCFMLNYEKEKKNSPRPSSCVAVICSAWEIKLELFKSGLCEDIMAEFGCT